MHECYAMQILETKNKKQKPKNNGHKEYSNEAQGSCQKDSINFCIQNFLVAPRALEFLFT